MEELEEKFPEDELSWITEDVAVTNFYTAHGSLAAHKIKAVLCLDDQLKGESAEARGLQALEVCGMNDGANSQELFSRAVMLLEQLVQKHHKVLVHCRAGKSRSLAVVAAYLVSTQGMKADEALSRVRKLRGTHSVAPELVDLVRDFAAAKS